MTIHDLKLPDFLERLDDGSIRIAGHRVTLFHILDSVYTEDDTEDIKDIYPTISQDDLRRVLGFCLRNSELMRQFHRDERRALELQRRATKPGPTRQELVERVNS
jgi:uncharacterized protein (DUF433 family)